MGESQLKRLKASLRAAGITGQQKPKKASTKARQSSSNNSRLDRNVALQSIREEFNPFEVKTTREKHDISGRGRIKGAQGRPGLSKQIGEDNVGFYFPSCSCFTHLVFRADRVHSDYRGRGHFSSRCNAVIKLVELWIVVLEKTTQQ